jgi:CheY-like chemotaxis protein
LKKKRKVRDIRNNLAVIFELEEEVLSVESDEVEEKKELDEDEKIFTEIMKSMDASPNASRFDWIENIIAADDQLINLEVLKSKLTEIGVQEKVTYCVNGQDTIDRAKRIIQGSVIKAQMGTTIKPINFLLLDFQMP